MKNICLSFFIILITILHANEELKSQIDMDYHLHLYSISRLSDGGVVKIPFRLGDVDFAYYNEDIKISSRLSLEYKPKFSDFYFDANYPQEFSIDLRELYLTWYFDNAELRVGKQIHTWGSVDQNSPLDNASPYDYYYIFSIGKEQKMGSFSGAFDYYFGNSTLGIVFSPIHHTNRLPLGNDDFPIELPVIPRSIQMQEVENEFEYGAYLKHSFDRSDITLSYYKGNDRVYNLSGINVYTPAANSVNPANLDSIFTHRKTEILGLGTSVVTDFVTIRADYGKFYTYDPNSDYSDRIRLDKLEGNPTEAALWQYLHTTQAVEEEAHYDQATLQFEFSSEKGNVILGLFDYNVRKYKANFLPKVSIPGLESDVDPRDYFYPGFGAPIAILTERAFMYQIKRDINSSIQLNAKGVNDLIHKGYLSELGLVYSANENLKIHMYINKIVGDDSQDRDYRFNQMSNTNQTQLIQRDISPTDTPEIIEYYKYGKGDFSHFRIELEYFF